MLIVVSLSFDLLVAFREALGVAVDRKRRNGSLGNEKGSRGGTASVA
jgi:hypothetical protein